MSEDQKYRAADFERYHSGKMSEAEMHSLEKAALEDSFLSDALEGYAYTSTPVKDIDELKEKLLQKKKKKNVFFLIQKQNIWLRIAAMFVLIAGIGYLAYQLNFNKENNTLATKQDVKNIKNPEEQTAVNKTDSPINNKNVVTFSQPKKTEEIVLNKPAHEIPKSSPATSKNNANESYQDDLKEEKRQTAIMPETERDEVVINREKNVLKGRLVDTLGKPVQNATIKDKNTITTSDADGKFKFNTNDSSSTATVSAIGYKTKKETLSNKNEPVIVMQHNTKDLNEVVVIGYGSRKQKKELSYSKQLENKAPGVVVSDSASQPITDEQKFDEYVKKNITIPVDEQAKSYKGKVILSFDVNKNGDPKKIKVEQSLCTSCDEEAIRLLQHGPKWKYIKDKRNFVTIRF